MPKAVRSAIAPLYLLACLILGGSMQAIWQNALLQVAGIGIIAWSAAGRIDRPINQSARLLLYLGAASVVFVIFQQVPIPSSIWATGPRQRIAEEYSLLGQSVPTLPLSLTPYGSLTTYLCLIPPFAMFFAIVHLKAARQSWLAAALLVGTVAGILLGAFQVASSTQPVPSYLNAGINSGAGSGFFANANHMASLLLMTLPFVAAFAASSGSQYDRLQPWLLTTLAVLFLILIAGIALTGSVVGYVLAIPILCLASLIVLTTARTVRWIAAAVATASVVVASFALVTSPIDVEKIGHDAQRSVNSREAILATTAKAIVDYAPFGTGLGSFARVYQLYESPDHVTGKYVTHAYDDYAELALEMGIPGIALILIFFVWWVSTTWAVWRNSDGGPFVRAATIASAVILILSLVDYPLRTAAISASFAMCLALMADRGRVSLRNLADIRPTRHLVIE